MSQFGARLKQAREQRGISLRQIATATKISMGALEALERNDFSRLPGGIFSRAFVRAYALEVGLDPEGTVKDFLAEYEQHGHQTAEMGVPEVTADDRAFLERQRRAARLLRNILIGVVLAVLAIVAGWKLRSPDSAADAGPVATTAAEVSRVAPSASPAPVEQPVPSNAAAPAPPAVTTPPAVPATPTAPEGDLVKLRLEITGECWVRITVDGVVLTERTLQAGDTRDPLPGRDVYVQVGNASFVRWWINGRPAKPLGEPGQPGTARVTRATMQQFLQ